MAQGFMLNVANVTGGDIDGGNSIIVVPQVNSKFNAQPTSPWVSENGGIWGNQYVEASGSNTLTLNLYTPYNGGISQGSINVVFDSSALSKAYFPNGQVYVNGFEPLQVTSNTWVYPFMQMGQVTGAYTWTLGMLYLLPVLDPQGGAPIAGKKVRK